MSTAPFVPKPTYRAIPGSYKDVHWSSDGRVVFEGGESYHVVDPAKGTMRRIEVEAVNPGYFSREPDILPKFIDREVFAVRDRVRHDLLAIDIDSGAIRVAIDFRSSAHLFVAPNGREVSRLDARSGKAGGDRYIFAPQNGRGGGTIVLDPLERLTRLGSAEAFALSRSGRFLALKELVTGKRVVVVVDPLTRRLSEVLELETEGPFAIGATADGGTLEWSARFAPLPTIDFTCAAPMALWSYVDAFPNAWLEFQSQSKDG